MDSVLHICGYASAYKGNFIESLLRLESFLSEKKLRQIYVFTARARKTKATEWIAQLKAQGHEVYILSDSFSDSFKLLKKIKKEHNIIKVFRHFADNQADILTFLLFKSKNTVHFFHGMYSPAPDSLRHRLRRIMFRGYTLVGVSQTVTNALIALFPKNRVLTVPNAICFERLNAPDSFDKIGKIACLAMGYNIKLKGADLAIDALAELNKKRRVELYICAASHLDELNALIKSRFAEQPEWLHILPPTENVATYFSGADILLAPSRSEGLPYAVIEASYCKAAVVASSIEQHLNLKIDKRYIFEKESIPDLILKTEKAIEELNSEQSLKIREEIKAAVQKQYNISSWCEEVFALI